MTTGQQACLDALRAHVDHHALDDVFYALRQLVLLRGSDYGPATSERQICNRVSKSIEDLRAMMRDVQRIDRPETLD